MNNQLREQLTTTLHQLVQLLEQLSDDQYRQRLTQLSGASVGQHVRHIIEFFTELHNGYDPGIVNYDARKRDLSLESTRTKAITEILQITRSFKHHDRSLQLVTGSSAEALPLCISTNYQRELLYVLEHTVHHMALLRIGVQLLAPVELPESFGVAAATIKFRQTCAR